MPSIGRSGAPGDRRVRRSRGRRVLVLRCVVWRTRGPGPSVGARPGGRAGPRRRGDTRRRTPSCTRRSRCRTGGGRAAARRGERAGRRSGGRSSQHTGGSWPRPPGCGGDGARAGARRRLRDGRRRRRRPRPPHHGAAAGRRPVARRPRRGRADVADRLPAGTRRSYDDFTRCARCGHVFWRGAHAERLDALLA
ncbi:Mut7-C RNAse domain-containing protein, partial [Pseudokineococcus marinus]|nr:hypothetical protein [Pseudokineococcus marinus]